MEVTTLVRRAPRRLISILATFGLLGGLLVASAPDASASGYKVTNKFDSGAGSLRKAITDANNHAGADTITFSGAVTGTITLASTLPTIVDTAGLTIQGPGAGQLTISGDDAVQIFVVQADAQLTLRDLTLAHAQNNGESTSGGAIDNEGLLTIADAELSHNAAYCGGGGAIYNAGSLTVTNSTFSDNQACLGGAIWSGGTLVLTDSTISSNTARTGGSFTGIGGGIGVAGGTGTITNSTIAGNSANGTASGTGGGGLFNNATVDVTNSTIANNSAAGTHGGGGILDGTDEGGISVTNTIVADNPTGTDCGDVYPNDGGGNVSSDDSCGFNGASLQNTDPGLGSLADNGGTTQTMALSSGSPVIDTIPPGTNGCGTSMNADQRHVPRPQGAGCDPGAFEYSSGSPSMIQGTVWNDANGNGQWDGGGSQAPQVPGSAVVPTAAEVGAPGVTVCLDEGNDGHCDDIDVSTTTGPNGAYEFDGLAPGDYHVQMVVPAGWHSTGDFTRYGITFTGGQFGGSDFFIEQNAASLSLSKSGDPDPVQELNPITYTIDVYDNGTADATNVVVTDTLPTGTTFISASTTQGSCSHTTTTVTCHLGTLPANHEGPPPVTIVVQAPDVTGNTTITNQATATASNAPTVNAQFDSHVLVNNGTSTEATAPAGLKAPITFTTSTVTSATGAPAADATDPTVVSLRVPKKGPGGPVSLTEESCTETPCPQSRSGASPAAVVFGGIVFDVVPPTGYTGRAPFQATLLWDASLNPTLSPVYYFKAGVTPTGTETVLKKCGKKPVSPCLVTNKKIVSTDAQTNGDWMVVVAINSDPKMRK